VKKQQSMKKSLKVNREALLRLGQPELQKVVGASLSCGSCFPDICQENDSSAC